MPLYTGDYIRDTRGLSTAQHGCYLLMLMFCWDSKGPLPLDEQEIAGICNVRSDDEVQAMRKVLIKYFIKTDDGYYNKRMAELVVDAEFLSKNRSNSGKLGAAVRARSKARSQSKASAKQVLSNSLASAKHLPETLDLKLNLKPNLKPNQSTNSEITKNTTHGSNPSDPCVVFENSENLKKPKPETHDLPNYDPGGMPTKAGAIMVLLRSEGIRDGHAQHPKLLELCMQGVEVAEFVDAARVAKDRNKGFSYVLGVVENRIQERDAMVVEAKAQGPPLRKSRDELERERSKQEFLKAVAEHDDHDRHN